MTETDRLMAQIRGNVTELRKPPPPPGLLGATRAADLQIAGLMRSLVAIQAPYAGLNRDIDLAMLEATQIARELEAGR